jgi:hypothetical protein
MSPFLVILDSSYLIILKHLPEFQPGEWRRLHNEELHDLYSSLNIQVMKLRRMSWAGHVACMGDRRGAYRVSVRET